MNQSFTSQREAALHGLTSGYQHMFGLPVARQWPYPRAMVPSGFLISSAQDLAHYVIAQLNDGQYQGQAVLSAQGMTAMHRGTVPMNAEESYAMGWADLTLKGTHILGHDRDSYNYHNAIYLLPDSKWSLVLLMNGSNAIYYNRMVQIPLALTGILIGIPASATTINNPLLGMNEFYRNSLVFAFLLLVVIIWTGIRLRRWSRNPASQPEGVRKVSYLVLPPAFFLWIAWLFLFSLPKAMGGLPLTTMFFFRPDLIGLAAALALLALGWGIYYEIRAGKLLFEKKERLVDDLNLSVFSGRS